MKKTLIAIAALVATGAFAQSSVTLTGTIDAGFVSSTQRGNSGMGYVGNITATSGFGLLANTDLGGGMAAYGKYWSDVNPGASYGGSSNAGASATNNLLGNSENKVGLKGGLGDIAFGAINDIGLESHLTATSFGTAIGSGTSSTSRMNAANKARSDNTIAYSSPRFSGFQLGYVGRKQQTSGSSAVGVQAQNAGGNTAAGATNTAAGNGQSAVSQFALRYNAGPLNVILSRVTDDGLNVQTGAATAAAVASFAFDTATGLAVAVPAKAATAATFGVKDVITNIAGNYTFGAATVYFASQGTKVMNATATTSDRAALTFGGKYVMGANTFMATMGRVTENFSGSAANGKSTKNLGLGYEYALSKTTSVVSRYERMTDDIGLVSNAGLGAGAILTAGNQDRSRVALGLRMGF